MFESTQHWNRPPRRWQAEAVDAVCSSASGCLVHAVTGAGKTAVIRELALRWDGHVLIAVPSIALVEQTAEAFAEAGKLYTHRKDSSQRVTVACYDSLGLYAVRQDLLVLVDEAHKSERRSVLEQVARLSPAFIVGLSATPLRSSAKEDLSLFATCVYSYPAHQAIADGVVVMPRVEQWTTSAADVDTALEKMIAKHAKGMRTMITASDVGDAEKTAKRFGGLHVAGTMSRWEINRRIELLRAQSVPVLVFVDLLAEGVDLPWLECLALRVPIGSPVQFCQRVGRVMRASADKRDCVILDPLDLFGIHSLSPEMALAGTAQLDEECLPPLRISDFRSVSDPILSGIWKGTQVWAWHEARPSNRIAVEVCSVESGLGDWIVCVNPILPGEWMLAPRDPVARRTASLAAATEAERMSEAQVWLRKQALELMRLGVAQKLSSRAWRKLDPTPKQLEFVAQLAKRIDPGSPVSRLALRAAWSCLRGADRGFVSDFITVLKHWGKL